MQVTDQVLQIISNETKGSINNVDIVTPTIYSSIFSKFASSHEVSLDDEKRFTDDLLNEKISIYTNLQSQTSQNAQKLSENADKALSAIKNKDESVLMKVLEETKNLRYEIEKLKESVHKDELTNVYNRKWLNDNLLKDGNQGFKSSGILTLIDLNYFKLVNDTYGHVVGDKVLVFIANQLKDTKESVIRYGGDEFIVIFPDTTTKKSALSKLDSIRENILKKSLKVRDSSFKTSFSFGVQEFKENDSLSTIIELADINMYDDKVQIKTRIKGI